MEVLEIKFTQQRLLPMFGNKRLPGLDLFLNLILLAILMILIILLILGLINLIDIDGLFHKLLNANKLLQILITMETQMRNIRNGNIQKPNHNIILLFVKLKRNINPETDHCEGYGNGETEEGVW